jgi:hypothetical protein
VSPATRLLEKRRQMFEVQDELDRQKEEFARREEAFASREKELRKKDVELQANLLKFNKFLQENEAKRTRAVKRAAEELSQRRKREEECLKLEGILATRIAEESAMRHELESNEKYRRFLMAVVEHGDSASEYSDISDVLNRYKTLKTANRDLGDNLRGVQDAGDKSRGDLALFRKEQGNEVLGMNNAIALLQRGLDGAVLQAKQHERDKDAKLAGSSRRTMELGQVLRGVENLMGRVVSSRARRQGIDLTKGAMAQAAAAAEAKKAAEKAEAKEGGESRVGGAAKGVAAAAIGADKDAEKMESDAEVAVESLGDVTEALLDYGAIVNEWASYEERKIKEARDRAEEEEAAALLR